MLACSMEAPLSAVLVPGVQQQEGGGGEEGGGGAQAGGGVAAVTPAHAVVHHHLARGVAIRAQESVCVPGVCRSW